MADALSRAFVDNPPSAAEGVIGANESAGGVTDFINENIAPHFNRFHRCDGADVLTVAADSGESLTLPAMVNEEWRAELFQLAERDPELVPIMAALKKDVGELSLAERASVRHFALLGDGLYFLEGGAGPRLVIPKVPGDRTRTLLLFQAHDSALHPGIERTYAALARTFFWFGMRASVERFVKTCMGCQERKSKNARAEGFRGGHGVPPSRWHTVAVDFITDLEPDAEGFDQILVVMDVLTKFVYLVPGLKTDSAEATAKRLFAHVFCVHGAPVVLQSDRDTKFCSAFFTQLMGCFNVRQAMGGAYDHRWNGIVENMNRQVECLLRSVLAHHKDRAFTEFLPLVAFSLNSAVHSSTKVSPYFALFGVEPCNPVMFAGGGVPAARDEDVQGVRDLVSFQESVLALVRDNMLEVQRAVGKYQNRVQRDVVFEVGEQVWLNSVNLSSIHFARSERKLRNPFVGPFEVLERRSEYTYRLKLTGKLKRVHPVFHAVMLKRTVADDQGDFEGRDELRVQEEEARRGAEVVAGTAALTDGLPDREVDEDGNELFFLEKVLERMAVNSKAKRIRWKYKVRWRGYGPESDSWVTPNMMVGSEASDMLKAFDETVH